MLLYRLLARIAFTAYALRLTLGGAAPGLRAERLGRAPGRRANGPLLWIHGASNGELTSARTVIETLLARAPDLRILVTANTETGRALARSWGHDRIEAALAPLDLPAPVRRFLDAHRPGALVVIENELWPERLTACARRGIPVFVIGARMSARSFRLWRRLPGLGARILGAIRYLSAQDTASEARFRDLGLQADRIAPPVNLKSAARSGAGTAPLPFPRAATLLAASTHEGEEEIVLDAFARARTQRPDLRLILAPRHPRRRDAIERLIARAGFAASTRSRGDEPGPETVVYLADTMGEMNLWYASAGMTFVGGSLVEKGGHTPFEPAAHGSALLHGPHTANSAPAYEALRRAAGAMEVRNAETLAAAIVALAEPDRQAALAEAAAAALAPLAAGDGLDPFFAALAEALRLPEPAP